MKLIRTIAASFVAVLLTACGEDSTTEKIVEVSASGTEIVSSLEDLPKCTKDNQGEFVLVKGEPTVRICVDGKWFATKESAKDTVVLAGRDTVVVAGDTVYMNGGDFSCKTEELKDGSGLKIVCNGDSIGVVKNGAKGETGKNGEDGLADGCEITQLGATMSITCNGATMRFLMDEDGNVTVDTTALDSEKVAVSLDEVSGASQKGPYLSGSKVLVRELRDGRSLAQTGNNFNGKILNDKGEFKINAQTLVSQYVTLEATGYYRNEVTGDNSSSELTLLAITNVLKSKIANINLLTHLEYERVSYLVTKMKYSVAKAKAQAQREVFDLFGIDATGFSSSEYLNIAGASDEDGALLAFSVLLQGDRSVSQLSELLTKIAADMETDGTWDDAKTRMAIAEWAADADSSNFLATIRNNVKGWNLSTVVPNFEQYVRNFWYVEYGLDSCNAKNKDMVKAATAGKRKGTKTRFICKADGAGLLRWQIASDFEKDTYQWKDTTDGALKEGAVTGAKYIFDKTGSYNGTMGWRLAVAVENVYGGCREALYDSIRSYRGANEAGYYLCLETTHRWVLTNNNLMIDTQGWGEGDDGFSKWGDSIGVVSVTPGNRICYVYDTSATYRGWRAGNNNDCTLDLMGCTKGRAGRMLEAEDGNFYICSNNTWSQVTDRVKYNTMGWACLDSNDGEVKKGLRNEAYFICDDHSWREATTDEELACRIDGVCTACTNGQQGKFETRDEIKYVCDTKQWRIANCAEIATESLCTANDSALVEACENVGNFSIDYICSKYKKDNSSQEQLGWHAVQHPFEYTLAQWNAKREVFNDIAVKAGANSDSMITDPRDGNTYRTVVINGKRVFAENLRYADSVTNVNLKGQTHCYNNVANNCKIGGAYYSWTAAMDLDAKWLSTSASALIAEQHQGICPEGWHIPTGDEWSALFGSVNYAALQAMGYSEWMNSTNTNGFSAIPVGYYSSQTYSNGFFVVGKSAYFWSVTEKYGYGAYRWTTHSSWNALTYQGADDNADNKNSGLSVRCIQDDPVSP